jgi:hypothetical protein
MSILQDQCLKPTPGDRYYCSEPEIDRPSALLTSFEMQRRDLRDRIAALANHLPGELGYPVRSSIAIPFHHGGREDTELDVYVVAVVQEIGGDDRNGFLQFCSPHKGPTARGDKIVCRKILDGPEVDMIVTRQLRVLACVEGNLREAQKARLEDELIQASIVLENLEAFVQAA